MSKLLIIGLLPGQAERLKRQYPQYEIDSIEIDDMRKIQSVSRGAFTILMTKFINHQVSTLLEYDALCPGGYSSLCRLIDDL